MPRWFSLRTSDDDQWHVWPEVSVQRASDKSGSVKRDHPAYCGHVTTDGHNVWNLSRDSRRSRVWWDEMVDTPHADFEGHRASLCALCHEVVRYGYYRDAEWQRKFRAEHDLGGDA